MWDLVKHLLHVSRVNGKALTVTKRLKITCPRPCPHLCQGVPGKLLLCIVLQPHRPPCCPSTSRTLFLGFTLPGGYTPSKSLRGWLSASFKSLLKFQLISKNFVEQHCLTSRPSTPFPLTSLYSSSWHLFMFWQYYCIFTCVFVYGQALYTGM